MNTSRRTYLSVVSVSAATLAGCLTDKSDQNPSEQGNPDGETSDPTDQDSSDDGPNDPDKASVEIVTNEVKLADSVTAPDEQIPWSLTEVRNPTSTDHGAVHTERRFYDEDETLLESRDKHVHYIPADTVWRDYIRYYTETPDRVDHVETRIVHTDPVVDAERIDEASVISSEFSSEPESGVDLVAEIDLNGAAPDTVSAISLFYDDQDRFRGTVLGIEQYPQETVAVSGGSIMVRTPPNLEDEQITSHELVVLDGIV